MRTLKLHFPADALSTLDTFLKQTQEARVFRRAQAVRAVVTGHRLQTVSDTFHFAYSALRTWVHRFAPHGVQSLSDRPRSGRPPQVTDALVPHRNHRVDHDPLQHGSSHSQWRGQELATVLARQTGVHLSRESVREVLKKARSDSRPTGRLAPDPAELSWASCALAALESRAQQGELILLYEEETIVWRFALPRAGWWRRTAQRFRLPTRPLRSSQITREEARKRQAWRP
jgi:transposase